VKRQYAILGAVVVVLILTTALLPRIPQDPAYHRFADTRSWFGIPNFLNVISNLPFLLVGLMGIRRRPRELWEYRVCFAGVLLTAFGSAWYHVNPNNATLVWDRLPMAIGFMGLMSAIILERTGLRLLILLSLLGAGSVFYWHFTNDLRIYGLVQFGPALLIPALILLFPARYTHTSYLFRIAGWYTVAKFLEHWDKQIFAMGGIVSGHTLKHLAGAWACYEIVRMITVRQASPCSTPPR
jgi:hypothetical protein